MSTFPNPLTSLTISLRERTKRRFGITVLTGRLRRFVGDLTWMTELSNASTKDVGYESDMLASL